MAYLSVTKGPNHGRTIVLTQSMKCRIGRDPSLDLSIDDTKASRVHVEIEFKDNQFVLRDLRSKNGTLVNGARISTVVLKEGDLIHIGETRMAFSLQEPPLPGARGRMDSIMAPRLPVGVAPALGQTVDGETFETLELDAALPFLCIEGSAAEPADELGETVSAGSVAPETPDTLECANRCLRALYSIARACVESTTAPILLAELCAKLQTALEADRVTPLLLDENGHWHVAETGPAPLEESVKAPSAKVAAFSRVPLSRTIVDYALRTRRSVLTAPRTDARFTDARSIGEQGITSALCVPIVSEDKVLGLIYADRLGGHDFGRPDQELLTAACLQAGPALAGLSRLEAAISSKDRLLGELKSQHHLLGECEQMKEVYGFIERAAPTEAVVLVLGESGTGKELVARAIHYRSSRSSAPLVIVNCAALSESLIESELFGHVKGAFTGATADRKGRFELAHEGTIFLDEIGELSNACQTKLLRVLEQGEISRVGESKVRKVKVRLLAATNRDLTVEVKAGRFREDLFYRLNVLALRLPPLRERGTDVLLLAEHYLRESAARGARPKLKFSDETLNVLGRYRWPGNVRELRNLTERLAVLCPHEVIGVRDLPSEFQAVAEGAALPEDKADDQPVALPPGAVAAAGASGALRLLTDVEKSHILRVLSNCGGNKKQAAETLGIDRSTLYAKLRAYGILT